MIKKNIYVLWLLPASLFMLFWDFYIADPVRAINVDRYILYGISDTFRYCYLRHSMSDISILLNPYSKPLSMAVSYVICKILSMSFVIPRVVNTLFSIFTAYMFCEILVETGTKRIYYFAGLLMIFFYPLYFLTALSNLAEISLGMFLVSAVFLWYKKKYFWATIIMSCVPLIRQEGLLHLALWTIFLPRKNRIIYMPILLFPSVIWCALSSYIYNESFWFPFTYLQLFMNKSVSSCELLPYTFWYIMLILAAHPLAMLLICGIKNNTKNFTPIAAFICAQLFFTFSYNVFLSYRGKGVVVVLLRYIVPVVPLMVFYAIDGVERIRGKINFKNLLPVILLIYLLFSTGHYLILQKIVYLTKDFLTVQQEKTVKSAAQWLDDYFSKNKTKNLYIVGEHHPLIATRKLWMSLKTDVNYYILIANPGGGFSYYDIFACKEVDCKNDIGVLAVVINSKEGFWWHKIRKKLIMAYPEINTEFYLLNAP